MPALKSRRCYISNNDAQQIFTSTETYKEMEERFNASRGLIQDIRCRRGRWNAVTEGLVKGRTHGRNQHGDPARDPNL